MITDTVHKMAAITDPEEMIQFMEETVASYKSASKPKTRLGYAVLILLWALIFTVAGIGVDYWLSFFLQMGWVNL